MKWLLGYTLTAFLIGVPVRADTEATPSPDKGTSGNSKTETTRNGKAGTTKTDHVPYPVMAPGEIEKHVNRLRKGLFSEAFREAYRRALEQSAPSPLEMDLGTPPAGGAEELPPVEADTGAESRPDSGSDSQPRPLRETIRERIVERVVIQVPQTNTRIIFVERPKSLPAARQTKEKEEEKNETKAAPTAPAAPGGIRVTSGAPTVIRVPEGTSGGTLFGGQKLTPREAAQAERSFREFDTFLPSSAAAAPAAAAGAGTAREGRPREEKGPRWKDEIVYVDDYEASPESDGGEAGAGRADLTAATAALQPGELTFGTFARSAVETVRRKTSEIPAVVLLINVFLMLGTALAFSLVAVRRRRAMAALAVSTAAPPARRPPPPMPSQAVALLPSPEEMEGEQWRREVTSGTGMPLNDDMRVVFDPTIRRWVLKRRDPGGRLSAPLAELQAGTVVRGAALGATSPQTRYKLSPSNTWIPTEEGEQIIIAVRPSHFRAI